MDFRRMKQRPQASLPLILLAALIFLPVVSEAQEIQGLEAREYEACMSLVNVDPDLAFEKALSLQDMGGGAPARHCAAAALAAGGHHEEAAKRFEALATEMPDSAPPGIVANILAHAGLSWLEAGRAAHAYTLQSTALDLDPQSPEVLIDRSMTLAELGRLWEAIDDLNRALQLDSGRVEALVLRASAYRQVEVYEMALEDANRALDFDPDNPEALLERGIVYRLQDKLDKARSDWIRIIEEHDGRPAAEMARSNLDKLDFGPEGEPSEDADGAAEFTE